ncbi:MAG TPA: M48 family metalloprotease, partial [Paludibacter sp.]
MKKLVLGVVITLMLLPLTVSAQKPQRDPKEEQVLISQLRQLNAAVVPQFEAGTKAMDEGNRMQADSLYSIVYAQAPDFDVVLRRLGTLRFEAGKLHEGLELGRKALALHEAPFNYLSLAYMYMEQTDSADINQAYTYLKKAAMLPGGDDVDITLLLAQNALQRNDIYGFEREVNQLVKSHQELMQTHYYAAILHIYKEKWSEADTEIKKAQTLGLSQETVDQLMNSGVSNHILKIRIWIALGLIIGIWVVGLLLLFGSGKIFSGLTLRTIEKGKLETGSALSGGKLRAAYKKLILAGSIYYYISLPVVLILVIAVTGGLIFLSLAVGAIPIKLIFILVIAAGSSIYSMVRSLMVKADTTDPGRLLNKEEAPGLYQLTDEVAQLMGTRPIDEIRITPLNDMAVYEKGSWREKINDQGKRILIVGTSVLNGFKTKDFKAVLAHEYGHFAHRDTAGGDIAFRVKRDIYNFIIALVKAGQNTVWNLSFHFLRMYYTLFCRITHGATRLQEVLADRLAAQTFGAEAFKNGLTHVIRREMEFSKSANQEIQLAVEQKRAISNL